MANVVGSALERRSVTFSKVEAGGGGGGWWGRLRWRYRAADSIYDWNEGGKLIYRDCRCEVASVTRSLMGGKATVGERARQ